MPQNPEDFSEEMPDWSKWKHEILLGYLGAFAGILQKFKTIYFVDGFAGAGRYDDGSKGSALRSAELARSIEYDPKRNYKLHCVNVELDNKVFQKLTENTKNYTQFVTNYQGSFEDVINEILDLIGDQPTLFFLDPFGVKELDWQMLNPIFKRKSSAENLIITEFLARFDVQAIARLHGCVGKTDERSLRNVTVLLKIFGLKSVDEWLKLIELTGDSLSGLAEAYQVRLREYFDYVVKMPIKKTNTGQLKYYLIFATRNEKAIAEMNNTLYKVEDMRESVIDKNQPQQLGFIDQIEDDLVLNELNTLKRLVLSVLPLNTPTLRMELITKVATLREYFGAFSGGHFTAVLGGKPRSISVPKTFVSLKEHIQLNNGTASEDKTSITRLK